MADVLVVEDDIDAADALAEVLRIEGHVIRVAFDGKQGLGLLEDRVPDLVLLDADMPVLSGPGMAARMAIQGGGLESVPIVLVSGSPDVRELATELGTPYFISKPFGYDRIVALVERALRERVPPRAAPGA